MSRKISLEDLDVSRETMESLSKYVNLLRKWNKKINLVSKKSMEDVWMRHILDSAQLFKFVNEDTKSWLDLGSGAGLPGLIIAILAKEKYPSLSITLVESDKRKCVFLCEVVRVLNLNVRTISERIECCSPQNADLVSARALTQLEKLFSYFIFHSSKKSKGLFLKGKNAKIEIDLISNIDLFQVKLTPSEVDKDGYLVEVMQKENQSE